MTARASAKARGIDFSITVEDLLPLPEFCAAIGIRLEYKAIEAGRRTDARATVDRVDNSKGYTPENVCIISWRANGIKRDASGDELRALAKYVMERGA